MKGLLLALLAMYAQVNAQVAYPGSEAAGHTLRSDNTRRPEKFMTGQILHVSEFIRRFNDAVGRRDGRRAALWDLFDEDDKRLTGSGGARHPYTSQIGAFVQEVAARRITIPERPSMEAIAGIKMNYKGSGDTLVVHLRKGYTADSASFWQIARVIPPGTWTNAKAEMQKATARRPEAILPPNAHEVSFLPLLRGLHDYRSLTPFTLCHDCRDEAWWQVENALRKGWLIPEAVVSNQIYLRVGNWRIELSEFIREKENSGWLISNLAEE
ncbi:hypothetical protein [Dyadobacter sp. 676]|uniref:Uncharacterized protein n=1 Tax=Dyadobacter sp. 676 TaxID=3088362 RepID=A0AAU8FJI9_9BACT